MPRRNHRRNPPFPLWLECILAVVGAGAVLAAVVAPTVWPARGAVGVVALVAVAEALLLRRFDRLLHDAYVQVARAGGALARAEAQGRAELRRRESEVTQLGAEVGLLRSRLARVTAANTYAAAVLAELNRRGGRLAGEDDAQPAAIPIADPQSGDADRDDRTEPAADAASSAVVQVWPSVDDTPTVVDLVRWDQVRRLAAGETDEERRLA